MSATWVARLASEPWLSTQERRFTPAAPRDLTVLTPAAFEIEGERSERYVHEIDAEHVDSPVVDALQIQGRPFASSIVSRLEDLRAAERAGNAVSQAWADKCYQALASYFRSGAYTERSDLSERDLRRAFSAGRGGGGLVRAGGAWLAPEEVRREPFLDESLPHVQGAEALWDVLDVKQPTVTDCVTVVRTLATQGEGTRSSEVRVFRYLLELAARRRIRKNDLANMPLHTYGGWQKDGKAPVFAVSAPSLAEALGEKWPVWRPPIPLDEVAPLLELLKIEVIEPAQFEPDIPSRVAAGAGDLRLSFAAGVGHLKDYLAINHQALHERLTTASWRALQDAE